jgi:hypothetical protein
VLNGSGKVVKRIIKSRAGHKILLDDSDNQPGIQIIDKTGRNKIHIDSSGNKLTIEVAGDVLIKAGTNLSIEANGNISLEATGRMSIKGNAIKVDGGPMVEVKGGIVKLN